MRRGIATVFLSVGIVAVLEYGLSGRMWELAKLSDLPMLLTGAEIVRNGDGANLYDAKTQLAYQRELLELDRDRLMPFRNPAAVALLFVPLRWLSVQSAYLVFMTINLLLLFLCWTLVSQRLNLGYYRWMLLSIMAFYWPVVGALAFGQLHMLLLLAFLGSWLTAKDARWMLAGALAGLLGVKPHLMIAIAGLTLAVAEDRKRYVIGLGLTAGTLGILSLCVTGWQGAMKLPWFLLLTEDSAFSSDPRYLLSLFVLLRTVGISVGAALVINGLAMVLAFWLLALGRRTLDESFSLIACLGPVLAVHSFAPDLVLLVLPLGMIVSAYRGKRVAASDRFALAVMLIAPLTWSAWSGSVGAGLLIVNAGLRLIKSRGELHLSCKVPPEFKREKEGNMPASSLQKEALAPIKLPAMGHPQDDRD